MRREFKQASNMRLLLAFLLIIAQVFILSLVDAHSDLENSYENTGGKQVFDWRDGSRYHGHPSLAAGQQDNIAYAGSYNGGQSPLEADQVIRAEHGDQQQQQHRDHWQISPAAHHRSSLPLDNSAMAIKTSGAELSKTNSLIESVLPLEDNQELDLVVSEQDLDVVEEERRAVKHSSVDGKNIGQTSPPSSTTETTATTTNAWQDNNEGSTRQHKNDWWCRLDCNTVDAINVPHSFSASPSSTNRQQTTICASDGRLYKNMCELRRRSCQHNTHLFRRPHVYCLQKRQTMALANKRADNGSKPNDTTTDQIRIIELKRRCQKSELDEMKLLLLREFNGDIESMFKYFDSNGDGSIEAHELWPRQHLDDPRRILYAQVRNEYNSSRCFSRSKEDYTKCWYFVDFAFEPQFESNPCSFSHLLLFDLKMANHRFSLDTFKRSFSSVKSRLMEANRLSIDSVDSIKKVTQVKLALGDSVMLECLPKEITGDTGTSKSGNEYNIINHYQDSNNKYQNNIDDELEPKCLWTRYNVNMATIRDAHISIGQRIASANESRKSSLEVLHLHDAQLYLSGTYKCSCHLKRPTRNFEHLYKVQVVAPPRVDVRPHYQWSLPGSRVSFECHYDYIDTSFNHIDYAINNDKSNSSINNGQLSGTEQKDSESGFQFGLNINWLKDGVQQVVDSKNYYEMLGLRNSLVSDGGDLIGYDELPQPIPLNGNFSNESNPKDSKPILSPTSVRASITIASSRLTLERLQLNDTGHYSCQVRGTSSELLNRNFTANIHSKSTLYSSDGTLLVQEQPKADQSKDGPAGNYLWMFNDNGISVYRFQGDDSQEMELVSEINGHSVVDPEVDGNWNQLTLCGGINPEQVVICEWSDNAIHIDIDNQGQTMKRYIYIGQPNLNRVAVFDSSKFEIVAIINTEPQPRKLFLYKPNKIHLSKWVRRHLSPTMNVRWLKSIASGKAYPLRATPDSIPYSQKPNDSSERSRSRSRRFSVNKPAIGDLSSNIIQYDIWLLCYGQPLVMDPSGDERLNDPADFYAAFNVTGFDGASRQSGETIQPFTPRLPQGLSFSWSVWSNKEAQLRNRKSVHIIQSTFFPQSDTAHVHDELDNVEVEPPISPATIRGSKDVHTVREFKKSTVITSHHIFSSLGGLKTQSVYFNRDQFDLIHDLMVPSKPYTQTYSFGKPDSHKTHYAYVTHYGERRLFRVSMDEYRYDQDIDLQNCDPISMISATQGLLVIQCRAPISHNLMGQLVLDQLTNAKIEFNSNIRAQESYLSPDNRYLISIYSNSTPAENLELKGEEKHHQAIVYVQLVTISGLKLQYEIKTSLDISQCSFVWKEGYYNAIFLSTNRKDHQSEILSLRLVDSRLELMARVPGVINSARHKKQLIVSPELRVAALSTDQGTFVVDLEDNRVSQSLRRHQSPPTLLWV